MNQDTQAILTHMTTLSEGERRVWIEAIKDLREYHIKLCDADSFCLKTYESHMLGEIPDSELERAQDDLNHVEEVFREHFWSMPVELQSLMTDKEEINLDLLITQQS